MEIRSRLPLMFNRTRLTIDAMPNAFGTVNVPATAPRMARRNRYSNPTRGRMATCDVPPPVGRVIVAIGCVQSAVLLVNPPLLPGVAATAGVDIGGAAGTDISSYLLN